jgi:hypothetical protein
MNMNALFLKKIKKDSSNADCATVATAESSESEDEDEDASEEKKVSNSNSTSQNDESGSKLTEQPRDEGPNIRGSR